LPLQVESNLASWESYLKVVRVWETRPQLAFFVPRELGMYLLYVDESGDPGPHGSDILLLGGAALFEGKWLHVESDVAALIGRYFPSGPRPDELHFAPLRQGRQVYRRLTPAQRSSLIRDFCSIVTDLLSNEVALFTVIADKAWWFASHPGKSGDDLYAELFEQLSSRFDLFLRRRYAEGNPNKGIIIADPHKPSLSDSLKRNQKLFQREGHRWGNLYNLIETVFFLDSSESPGLQIADLCSYGVWRLVTTGDDTIAQAISGAFDREPLNSRVNPGKWHGVHFLGKDPTVRARLAKVWP